MTGIRVVKYLTAALLLIASGCDYLKDAQKPSDEYQGRKETTNVRALDAVGYNGQAVRKAVDKVLDTNDARNKEIEKTLK